MDVNWNTPRFEVNALIFDAICRAAKAGIEAEELLLGSCEMAELDSLLASNKDLLPAELVDGYIEGGCYFGLRVRPMKLTGAAAR